MKKIALIGCYFQHNYGSMLQAYALQEFLVTHNFSVENIDVSKLEDFENGKKKYYRNKIFDFKFVHSKFGMLSLKIKKKVSHSKKTQYLKVRDRKFNEFKHNFILSKKYHTYKELNDAFQTHYSDAIVGSDQLWLPVNVVADYYTLNFVPDNINKISYATSLGMGYIPSKYKDLYRTFLSRIEHLSVREENASKLINDNFNIYASTVCDPTMLLTCDEWLILSGGERRVKDKYIFVYFLGENKNHWNFVKRLKETTGYQIVSLNHCNEYFKIADKYSDMPLYDVDPFDFINLVHNAEYICTDSFHGSVFSILNNKKFFAFRRFSDKSKVSTNSRIYSLLKELNLEDHLLQGDENICDVLKMNFDYTKASQKISDLRDVSSKWLLSSIAYKNDRPVRVSGLQKWECCGCYACINICPKKCILMKADDEGFFYPLIDEKKCIKCGLCMKVCPANNKQHYDTFEQYGYVVQNKDSHVLKESTSGGAFTAFANSVLDRGGSVYGVKLDSKTFEAYQAKATKKEELWQFRGSKYVQSVVGNTYSQVRNELNEGKMVLYSGTTCQVEGLYSFLILSHADMTNLYMADVICHCVVSPAVLKKYVSYQEERQNKKVSWVIFRDKSIYGYNFSNLSILNNGKIIYHNGLDKDPYMKLMFNGTTIRPSCAECHFKHEDRHSDITIWDCFDIGNYDAPMNNNKGATKVLINSKKGEKLFDLSKEQIMSKQFTGYELTFNNYEMFNAPYENKNRAIFFKDMLTLSNKKLFEKYGKPSIKDKVNNFIKHTLIYLHLYSKLKSKKLGEKSNG